MPTAAAQEQVPPAWPRLVLDLLGGASCGPACMCLSSCPVILSTVRSPDLGVIEYVQRENTLVKRNLFVYGASCCSSQSAFHLTRRIQISPLQRLHVVCYAKRCIHNICTGFRFFVTNVMALVTATVFLRTNLKPDSVASGNLCEHWLQQAAACCIGMLA